jgi:hypothetical protein
MSVLTKKRVGEDLRPQWKRIKEQPRMRAWILNNGVRPHIMDGVWDGFWIEYPNAQQIPMFGSPAIQMRRMAGEGIWAR